MKIKRIYFFLILITCNLKLIAQDNLEHTAPTLQIGLDGLNFNKGTLDYELILQMISEKQKDLKLKVVQNMFLERLYPTGGAVYTYADNVITGIIVEKDPDIRSRKVLESTVNLVFTLSFKEFFQKTAVKIKGYETMQQHLNALEKLCRESNITQTGSKYRLFLVNMVYNKFRNKDIKNGVVEDKGQDFKILLLDMASEVVRKEQYLKNLGLMQVSYSATYEYMNKYLALKKPNIIDVDNECKRKKIERVADCVYKDMQEVMSQFTQYIGLVNFIRDQNTYRNEQTVSLNIAKNITEASNQIIDLASDLTNLTAGIKNLDTVITNYIAKGVVTDSTIKVNIAELVKIRDYLKKAELILKKANITDSSRLTIASDIIYTLHADFVPILTKLTYMDAEILEINDDLKITADNLANKILSNNTVLKNINGNIDPFVTLIANLYQFNKAKTFSDYIKQVNNIAAYFEDTKIKYAIDMVNSFVKDYTVIRYQPNGKDVIDFNIESYLVKLQRIKKDKYSPVQFHFTVGANTGYFGKELMIDGEPINSFNYIGEKIGLKFKIFDYDYTRSRNPGDDFTYWWGWSYKRTGAPKEPLVSNMHLLLYGSGLLYNILNSTNNKNFNATIIGTGFGFTFSNALDLNFTASFPVLKDRTLASSFDYKIYSVGFDVQFMEYFDRLTEKKKYKK